MSIPQWNWPASVTAVGVIVLGIFLIGRRVPAPPSPETNYRELPVQPLRALLLEKLDRSRGAWDRSVGRFRALHWTCLIGVIVVPTCIASLGKYMPALTRDILAVVVAIFGSVQSIVKPADKFLRDIEFRDEADYLMRQAMGTDDPVQLRRIMTRLERVERLFHQGQHPWRTLKQDKEPDVAHETAAGSSEESDQLGKMAGAAIPAQSEVAINPS